MGGHRRHVGGGGLQPHRLRIPPASSSSAAGSSPNTRSRGGERRAVAARRVRLRLEPTAAHQGRRARLFFTIKISWSQYNRLPYDSFWWQGLDGTRVLTHFSPTPNDSHPASPTTPEARPVDVLDTWRQHRQREVRSDDGTAAPMLLSYGHGDGGGGPTREMVENLTGLEAFPSMPEPATTTVKAFFAELEKVADRLPVWNGELYLEYHRGTYTSQAATKWGNRRGEFGLHNAEFLAAWARLLTDADYPAARLTEAWKLLCLNQFHDIIPGSSIGEVYQDTAADHRRIADLVSETGHRGRRCVGQGASRLDARGHRQSEPGGRHRPGVRGRRRGWARSGGRGGGCPPSAPALPSVNSRSMVAAARPGSDPGLQPPGARVGYGSGRGGSRVVGPDLGRGAGDRRWLRLCHFSASRRTPSFFLA